MANMVPARFKRVADAFDEAAMTLRTRPPCGSSGSEHSAATAESFTDLSGLVNSFMEKSLWEGIDVAAAAAGDDGDRGEVEPEDDDVVETKNDLVRLLSYGDDDVTKRKVHEEVEKALRDSGDRSSPDFKRRLMARLRYNGLDAGVCKSRWEKIGRCPRGDYEYIDVNINGGRYIIEVSLRREFEIVRPTATYNCLLETFPPIFVAKIEELKKIARIMSNAIRKSMKKMGIIHVPPWRRFAYMQAKWLSSYKRTTNEIAATQEGLLSSSSSLYKHRRSVGFAPMPEISFKCREDFGIKSNGVRIGNLAAALSGK